LVELNVPRGGLRDDDVITLGRDLVDHLPLPGAARRVDAGDLVIHAAVAAVAREALDRRVDDLDAEQRRMLQLHRPLAIGTALGIDGRQAVSLGHRPSFLCICRRRFAPRGEYPQDAITE